MHDLGVWDRCKDKWKGEKKIAEETVTPSIH